MKNIFGKMDRYFCKQWHLAVLDKDAGRWIVQAKTSNIAYLKAENANDRHILIQPLLAVFSYYMLIDDVNWQLITRQHKNAHGVWKPGRMVIETSKQNYQVWIRSSRALSLVEKRYWLKRLHSDPGADPNNRWGRCPGFRNRKAKYRDAEGGYPLSRLIWIDWKCRADIPAIHQPEKQLKNNYHQPDINRVYRQKQMSRSDYQRNDESATDFAYALALLRMGYCPSTVSERILTERSNWKNHSGEDRIRKYLDRTIKHAADIIALK